MPEIAGQWGDKQLTSQDQDGGWDVAKFAKPLLHGWRNEQLGSLHSKREKTLETGLAWPGSPGWPVLPGPRVASLPKNRPVLTMGRKYVLLLLGLFPVGWKLGSTCC